MAFVAKTPADARDYMIEGPAGVLRNPPLWCLDAPDGPWPKYEPSKRRITWPNGTWATVFSSEEPDGLRGFSGDTAWLDEYCFVAGTMVGTERGPVPIENVQSGMMVRTRAGFRPVVEHRLSHPAAEVYRLTLDDGRTLTGTGGHPIWVEGEGFIPLRSVSKGSILVTCQINSERASSPTLCGADGDGGCGAHTTRIGKAGSCIEQSTEQRSGPSRWGWTSTTRTATRQTTIRQTLKHSRVPSTFDGIDHPDGLNPTINGSHMQPGTRGGQTASRGWQHAKSAASNSPRHAHTRRCDFAPCRALQSTAGTASNTKSREVVSGAERILEHSSSRKCDSAHRHAPPKNSATHERVLSNLHQDSASFARQSSRPTPRTPFAADRNVAAFTELRVRGVELLSAKQPVYNLEVAETPEYFANGILVHNCKYKNPREVWENLQFGMREVSADRPRVFISTTPRPVPILTEIEEQPTTVVVTGSSYENRANLAPEWFTQTLAAYEGTRLGRQEIHGELLEDVEGLVYSSFSKLPFPLGNVDASVVDTGAEILVGQDFNVNPMASVVGVRVADELHILDALEVHTSNTEEVAGELRRRYPGRRIIVCPDPAGKARHTSSPVGQTDFTILRRAGFEVRAPNAAPLVVDRVNNTQAMLLQGERRRIRIHPRAKALITALSNLCYKEGTSIRDKGSGFDHSADALDYLVWEEFRVLRPAAPTIRFSHVRI